MLPLVFAGLVVLAGDGAGTKLPMTELSVVVLVLAVGLTVGWLRLLYR